MQNLSDTRGVHFDPEQIAILSRAYEKATAAMTSRGPLSEDVKSIIAKTIVQLGRQKLRTKQPFDAVEISTRTAEFVQQLEPSSLH